MKKILLLLPFTLIACSKSNSVPSQAPFVPIIEKKQSKVKPIEKVKAKENSNLPQKVTAIELPNELLSSSKLTWGEKVNISYKVQFPGSHHNQIVDLTSRGQKTQRYLRYKSLNYLYKKISNKALTRNDDFVIGDENAIILPKLTTTQYLKMNKAISPYSKKAALNSLHSSYDLSFKLKSQVKETSNIKLKSYFLNTERNSLSSISNKTVMRYEDQIETRVIDDNSRTYLIRHNSLTSKKLFSNLNQGNRIVTKIIDYSINESTFSKLHKEENNKFARIIISTPKEDKVLYAHKGDSLTSAIQRHFDHVEISQNGNIKHIDKLTSEVFDEDYFSDITLKELSDKSGWFHFEEDITAPLQEQSSHFVIFSSWNDVVSNLGHKMPAKKLSGGSSLRIDNLKGNEIVSIELSGVKSSPKIREVTKNRLHCKTMVTNARVKGLRKTASCSVQEKLFEGYSSQQLDRTKLLELSYISHNGIKQSLIDLKNQGSLKIVSKRFELDMNKLQLNGSSISVFLMKEKRSENIRLGTFNRKITQRLSHGEVDVGGFHGYSKWSKNKIITWQTNTNGLIWIQ